MTLQIPSLKHVYITRTNTFSAVENGTTYEISTQKELIVGLYFLSKQGII